MIDSIQNWTPAERQEVLFTLMREIPGPLSFPNAPGVTFLPIVSTEKIEVGETKPIAVFNHVTFKPKRLVILEPMIERIEREEEFEDSTTGPWYRRQKERVLSRRVEHRKEVTASRNLWTVQNVLIGAQYQFTARGPLRGDLFGPSGDLDFDGTVCHAGISITMQVRHDAVEPLPFYGVILGTKVEPHDGFAEMAPKKRGRPPKKRGRPKKIVPGF